MIEQLKEWEKSLQGSLDWLDDLSRVTSAPTEGRGHLVVFGLAESYTRALAENIGASFDLLSWFAYENGFGACGMAWQGVAIKSTQDLADLIMKGQRMN